MFQHIKRLTQHSLVYGIGHIVSRTIGFLLLPVHTNVLNAAQYGSATLLFSSLAILNVVFTYGMDVAFLRFYTLEDSEEARKKIFSAAWWMILFTGWMFAAVLMIFAPFFSGLIFDTPAYPSLIRLAAGILLSDALCLLPFMVLRADEKSGLFIALKLVNVILNLGMNVLFVVVLRKGVSGVFISNLVASLFTLCALMPVAVSLIRFTVDRAWLKELLHFGLPYVPSGLALLVMDQINRFFLDRMIGKEATGIFSASYKLGMFMALIIAAFRFAWHPFFLSTARQNDAPRIFARILTYFVMTTGWFFLAVSYFLPEIIRLKPFGVRLFGEAYVRGVSIVPVILLAYIAYGLYVNFIVGVYLKKKTGYLPLVTGLGAVVSLIANQLLIGPFRLQGAAWATFSAYSVMAAGLYIISQKLYPIPYEGRRLGIIVMVTGLYYMAGTVLLDESAWTLRLLLILSELPVLWILPFFSHSEKGAAIRTMKKMFRGIVHQ